MKPALAIEPFTLGRPFGLVEQAGDRPSGPETRPFGLRFVVTPEACNVEVFDPSLLAYDERRQIALIRDEGALHPVMRHTSNQTSTSTSSHDKNAPDSDTDVGSD